MQPLFRIANAYVVGNVIAFGRSQPPNLINIS